MVVEAPPPAAVSHQLMQNAEELIDTINTLLNAVFGSSTRLSTILMRQGLSEQELQLLRRRYLVVYGNALLQRWCAWLLALLPPREGQIIVRYFALDGRQKSTLSELGVWFDLSRERIRQLKDRALRRISSSSRRNQQVKLITDVARELLTAAQTISQPEELLSLLLARHQQPEPHEAKVRAQQEQKVSRAPVIRKDVGTHNNAAPSRSVTEQLFLAGMTPAEIAAERGLTEGTIYGHLAGLIEEQRIDLQAVVPAEIAAQIRNAIAQENGRHELKSLKVRLPDTITYGQILCVLAAERTTAGQAPRTDPEVLNIIQDCVDALSEPLSRSGLAKLCAGSASVRVAHYRDSPFFGRLSRYSWKQLMPAIDELITRGVLTLTENRRVILTTKPLSPISSRSRLRKPGPIE